MKCMTTDDSDEVEIVGTASNPCVSNQRTSELSHKSKVQRKAEKDGAVVKLQERTGLTGNDGATELLKTA